MRWPDEDLRHGAAPVCAPDHLNAALRPASDIDFGECNTLAVEQFLCRMAIVAVVTRIDLDRSHEYSVDVTESTIWELPLCRQPAQIRGRRPDWRPAAGGHRRSPPTSARHPPGPGGARQSRDDPQPGHETRPACWRRARSA